MKPFDQFRVAGATKFCKHRPRWRVVLGGVLAAFGVALGQVQSPDGAGLLDAWLENQARIDTWSAEVVQTRDLKTLTQPLSATGRVWFAAPDRFRWELGTPARTIAIRQPDQLIILYPRLKRLESYRMDGSVSTPWRGTLALLEAGFPRNRADLDKQFRLLLQQTIDGTHEVELEPRTEGARQMMPRVRIGFSTNDLTLQFTELEFADGSRMRNVFRRPVLNADFPPELMNPPLPDDFEQIER